MHYRTKHHLKDPLPLAAQRLLVQWLSALSSALSPEPDIELDSILQRSNRSTLSRLDKLSNSSWVIWLP